MKPTNTKFISRAEAEIISAASVADELETNHEYYRGSLPMFNPKSTALISINSPDDGDPKERALRAGQDGEPKVDNFWNPLRLKFHDIDPHNCGEEFKAKWILFDEAMAERVLDYLIEVEQAEGVYSCWAHCQAGVSRSAGVSKFIADIYNIYFNHGYRYHNDHVYKTLRSVYNVRRLNNQPYPGIQA